MPDTQPSIVVEGLTKSYGDFKALDGISFQVQPGEIVGFLGPNGAGKTTTMKILTCFMAATSGSAKVAGLDVYDSSEDVRKKIGYLPESVPLYDDMIVYDYLEYVAELRGVPSDKRKAAIRGPQTLRVFRTRSAATFTSCQKVIGSGWGWRRPSFTSPTS
ncbi:MAG: ATP-binding cassette domain-containing protein [bacterium]